jgi:hypothetical protein
MFATLNAGCSGAAETIHLREILVMLLPIWGAEELSALDHVHAFGAAANILPSAQPLAKAPRGGARGFFYAGCGTKIQNTAFSCSDGDTPQPPSPSSPFNAPV